MKPVIPTNPGSSMSQQARHWAIRLTNRGSVTGTPDEASFAQWLAGELRESDAFGAGREVWTFPVAEGDPRHCVAMLLRRGGARTVILTGHFDTVSVEDYGDLRGLATQPEELASALLARLAQQAGNVATRLAVADLNGGAFLAGRGLLDMKAGLAAGLAAISALAAQGDASGNILFLAVPDEENNSAGARRAAQLLPDIALLHGLEFSAVINLDSIADPGDGEDGRVIALGTVGKLLPTALVVGVPTHSGFPFNGLNAAVLAAAIAARVEWCQELTEGLASGIGTAPSLLSLRDGKSGYDVTTPATAFATFNVLVYRRKPVEVLDVFDRLCGEAVAACAASLRSRAGHASDPASRPGLPDTIRVYRYEEVATAALERDPGNADRLGAQAQAIAERDLPLPERCRLMTEHAWMLSGLAGPAVVTGFGSIPYLPTHLSAGVDAARLRSVAVRTAAESEARFGASVRCVDYFAGISDMSFFGEADETTLQVVSRNTPLWAQAVRWPEQGGIANLPTINIGPWGRDYHTPLERLHAGYAFDVLPRLLVEITGAILDRDISER